MCTALASAVLISEGISSIGVEAAVNRRELVQERHIELVYVQYLTEAYTSLGEIVEMLKAANVTHVFMNFGLLMYNTDRSCGPDSISECPDIGMVCSWTRSTLPFNLYWMTTTPEKRDGNSSWLCLRSNKAGITGQLGQSSCKRCAATC
jgi:hypothetical protein